MITKHHDSQQFRTETGVNITADYHCTPWTLSVKLGFETLVTCTVK